MARLRVGVIGCGTVAQIMWLPNLWERDDLFEIAALCDVSPGLLAHLGAKYGVAARYTEYRDLIAHDLDVVLVLTPASHAAPAIAALAAGRHVIVEKPMAYTLREADAMIAASERAGKRLIVAYMKRYDPGYTYARDVIRRMTDLRYVQINVLHPDPNLYYAHHRLARFADVSRETFAALAAADDAPLVEALGPASEWLKRVYRDVILGSMCHDVNALRGILGTPDDVLFTTIWPENAAHPTITTVLAYTGGPRVVCTWSYLAEVRDYFQEHAYLSDTGRVRIQWPSPWLKHFPTPIVVQGMEEGAEWCKRVNVSYAEAFQEELLHFHACITEGRDPETDARDGREDIALLQRITAAAHPPNLGGEAARGEAR